MIVLALLFLSEFLRAAVVAILAVIYQQLTTTTSLELRLPRGSSHTFLLTAS